jgi:hypothetical protein
MTERAFVDAPDKSPEGLRAAFETFQEERKDTRTEVVEVIDIETDGDKGSFVVTTTLSFPGNDPRSMMVSAERFDIVWVDERWKADMSEYVSPEIPDGVTTIDLEAKEYEFSFDETKTASGRIAFVLENTGTQDHQVDIQRVPADLDLARWFRGEVEGESEAGIGGTVPIEPGVTRNIVFSGPLPAGRYVMMCFISEPAADTGEGNATPAPEPTATGEETPEEEPAGTDGEDASEEVFHLEKGMWREFTVE